MDSPSDLDVAADLYVALGRLVRTLRRETDAELPVGPGGVSVLLTLHRQGGLRLGELAEVEGISAPSLTRIVNALDEQGLVERTPDPRDGRAQVVSLSAVGDTTIRTGTEARMAYLRQRIAGLSEADRRSLEAALPVLAGLGVPG